jgi:uncharacterized membrane protein
VTETPPGPATRDPTTASRVRARREGVLLSVAAAAVGLAGGLLLKAPCADGRWTGQQYRRLCYSDIVPLYGSRGLSEGRFPYLQAELEYPVGTGIFVGLAARATTTLRSFVAANEVGLALAGLATAAALGAMAKDRRRALLYGLGPPLVLYAFHNWDLLAVALATLGAYAFLGGAPGWAGILLGLGAATKLYPAFLVPPFALAARRSGRGAARVVAGSVGGFVALNLPFAVASWDGWSYPWRFQSERGPNYETLWFMVRRHLGGDLFGTGYPTVVNLVSGLAFVAGVALLCRAEARRERIRPLALGFGILLLFLLTAKVFSPQYALWLLPFFVLLRLPWWSYAAFVVTDALTWVATASFFLAVQYAAGDPDARLGLVEAAVWARYAALLVLLWLSRRAEEAVAGLEGPAEARVA